MTSETQPKLEPSEMTKPYTFFLMKRIDQIYEAWDIGDIEQALRRACNLVVFLPTNIKEVLWDRKKAIQKDMRNAFRVAGVDFFTKHLNRNRVSRRVAMYHLERFVDEMVRLLDEKQWLERGALRPRFPTKRKLRV